AAGANDLGDLPLCPQSASTQSGTCRSSVHHIGDSGVYFSFDRGRHWTQPTYTGWTGFDCASGDSCVGHVGPIHTLPWYYESGMVASGDPALAFGPVPIDGKFSWANGSRLYYATLAGQFNPKFPNTGDEFKGYE